MSKSNKKRSTLGYHKCKIDGCSTEISNGGPEICPDCWLDEEDEADTLAAKGNE